MGNIYKVPESKSLELKTGKRLGVCPLCGVRVGIWPVLKPTLRFNKVVCRTCQGKIEIAYPKRVSILIQVLASLIGGVLGFLVIIMTASIIESRGELLLLACLLELVAAMIICTLAFGYLEAKVCTKYFPFRER